MEILYLDKTDTRKKLDEFNDWIGPILDKIPSSKILQIIHILEEMVKNVIDHSCSSGYVTAEIYPAFMRFNVKDTGFSIFKNFNLNKEPTDKNFRLGIECIINTAKAINASLTVTDMEESIVLNESDIITPSLLKPRQGIEYQLIVTR